MSAAAILPPAGLDRLRTALAGYTVDAVHDRLGWVGQAALQRGDLSGVARVLRGDDGPLATLVRLFLLGLDVEAAAARRALAPLDLAEAAAAGLVLTSAGSVRAALDLRPYAEIGSSAAGPTPWWVVSDLGSDVRPGPLATDHVLGVGAASLTLAQAAPRAPVGRALDLGTGCGVQALHLATHAGEVVATDVSTRALRFAATTAALSGQTWHLRRGSLLEPVAGQRFDQIVANPPFVVSPGTPDVAGHDYRDGGRAGDALCADLLRGIPELLAPGGSAQLLANWLVPGDGDWAGRVTGWLAGRGCDAWIWQREVAEPGEYVSLWLRDAGETPGTPRWSARYDAWLDWFARTGVPAIGMGVVFLWRAPDGGGDGSIVLAEDVPQPVEQPVGAWIDGWVQRARWSAATDDAALVRSRLRVDPSVVVTREGPPAANSAGAAVRVRQTAGAGWDIAADEDVAALLAGLAGPVAPVDPAAAGAAGSGADIGDDDRAPLVTYLAVLAAARGLAVDDVVAATLPVVRDLLGRGVLLPPG